MRVQVLVRHDRSNDLRVLVLHVRHDRSNDLRVLVLVLHVRHDRSNDLRVLVLRELVLVLVRHDRSNDLRVLVLVETWMELMLVLVLISSVPKWLTIRLETIYIVQN